MKIKKYTWTKTGRNNLILGDDDGFYISYNRDTGLDPLGSTFTMIANRLGEDVHDGEETALCINEKFYILEGDFRKEYEEAYPDKKKCKQIYLDNQDKKSNWSNEL